MRGLSVVSIALMAAAIMIMTATDETDAGHTGAARSWPKNADGKNACKCYHNAWTNKCGTYAESGYCYIWWFERYCEIYSQVMYDDFESCCIVAECRWK
jgi:hypothetical protein